MTLAAKKNDTSSKIAYKDRGPSHEATNVYHFSLSSLYIMNRPYTYYLVSPAKKNRQIKRGRTHPNKVLFKYLTSLDNFFDELLV